MDEYIVFTNNPIVVEYFKEDMFAEIRWVGASAMEVLAAAKAAARAGEIVLLSNPLSGVHMSQQLFGAPDLNRHTPSPPKIRSINPFLSVLAKLSYGAVDLHSVKDLEMALSTYKKNARLRFTAHNDEAIRKFYALDLDIIVATLATLDKEI